MMRRHGEGSYLERLFDFSIRDHSLIALRPLDNRHAVTPFLLESDGAAAGFPSM